MKNVTAMTLAILMAAMIGSGPVNGDEVLVDQDITVSTTWTADNVYNLQKQIYVKPGATLTIEAGTLIQSDAPTGIVWDPIEEEYVVSGGGGGSLAVTRGAKIYVLGTEDAPVIMTSTNDDLQTWRPACNEWGNLTIMGNGYISASHYGGEVVSYGGRDNTKTPDPQNQKQMEGLVADPAPGEEIDPNVMYGGGDDDDDSGSISYLSLRYGGKVIGLANELNGLSLGGIGRETDIHHVEIMNNVDDGIEIWGGTVNLKYVSIWNIGDDSFDVDQGWRGKAQFGLIVQGYSFDSSQGSGVGDNCFETDGAEDSDAQPVTTSTIYNFTVIGQYDGDGATTWRDNARMQYRNCSFIDIGEKIVRADGDDGDGASGYGYNGTLSWEDTWTTAAGTHSAVNAPANPGDFYTVQQDGNLAEIRDCVFFEQWGSYAGETAKTADYVEAIARGVFSDVTPGASVSAMDNVVSDSLPIVKLQRGAPVAPGGKAMFPVTKLDPRAAGDAATSVGTAPADGFFTPVQYRGGFSPDNNWLMGWTAADAFGFLEGPSPDGPAAEMAVAFTTISFETDNGVIYTIEESTDGQNWSPVTTVVGDGDPVNIQAELGGDFDGAKLYRAIVQ